MILRSATKSPPTSFLQVPRWRFDRGRMRVLKIGNRSMTIGFEIYREGEDDVIVTCETVYVGYDTKNRASKPISDLMRQLLGA